jgi:hypothetical protein
MRKGSHLTEEHKAKLREKRFANPINNHAFNALDIHAPEVAKQWDYEKNYPLNPSHVTVGSYKKAWWICEKRHSWEARISSRTGKSSNGCPYCDKKKVAFEDSLVAVYPKIASEWDTVKNYPLTVDNTSSGSNRRVWWKCSRGHSWITSVHNRTGKNQNGCPICGWQSSKLQLFVYCEVKYFYPDACYSHNIDGIECDIYIPEVALAIEVDGGRWHKDSLVKDNSKVERLNEKGILVIRLREDSLPVTKGYVVKYKRNANYFKVTQDFLRLLQVITSNDRLKVYDTVSMPLNANLFNDEASRYPLCCGKVTLAEHNPELCKLWDYEKNYPLTPDKVAPKSNLKVWWLNTEGDSKLSQICMKNRLPLDKTKKVV